MFIDPLAHIDQTIRNLEEIAELFSDEFDERIHSVLTLDGRIYRDAHAAIHHLLPKLRAARAVHVSPQLGQRPQCINCD